MVKNMRRIRARVLNTKIKRVTVRVVKIQGKATGKSFFEISLLHPFFHIFAKEYIQYICRTRPIPRRVSIITNVLKRGWEDAKLTVLLINEKEKNRIRKRRKTMEEKKKKKIFLKTACDFCRLKNYADCENEII